MKSTIRRVLFAALAVCLAGSATRGTAQEETASPQPGLLFYLSGDHGFKADYAANKRPEPNYLKDVKLLPGGAQGDYLQCGDNQLLSYWAPGNIYAQRGTLSFFWRSRTPVDATEFPVFRVGFGDHSSWDMVWLRIDYNGHGFDAFVTDVNLGRTRVSVALPQFPKADEWTHLAISWDERSGIRFYINGKLAATRAATGLFDTALDQFGPHSRIIAPTGVESSYNYDRGGDLDELRIYDRALSDDNIAGLAHNRIPAAIPDKPTDLSNADRDADWLKRYGWNRPGDLPKVLPAPETAIRKVEIHDAYDLKRWWWRATDGIRETTWPGVYNRSRLVGRFDYFQLPDWDCYSLSGKAVTFYLPQEPWNHLEMEGGAWGNVALLTPGNGNPRAVADPDQHDPTPQLARTLFERPRNQERTTHDFAEPIIGGHVRFTNVEQEEPIGEFAAYMIQPGREPDGSAVLRYTLSSRGDLENPSLHELTGYIQGRFPAGEQTVMIAAPGGAAGDPRSAVGRNARSRMAPAAAGVPAAPVLQVLIPADFRAVQADEGHGGTYGWENMHAGLDGIALDLPALHLKPAHGGIIPMNIRIADPIWPMRAMLDISFSVKPDQPYTLWLDTRDRLLPNGKSLWLSIASASPEFTSAALEGARLRLVFKPWDAALPEHIADRTTEVRDVYANLVEENVASRKLNTFNRIDADLTDLLRVDPTNDLGRKYWAELNREQPRPPYTLPATPAGVPEWAFLQVEDLRELKSLIEWYIDNRQISNGEFGGGLSDDSDFLNWWPPLALMGADPDKLQASLLKTLEAMYDQKMFANGLASAQYDELHAYEDGINVLSEAMMLDYGSPRLLERAMETSRRLEWLTGYNSAGQRQIRSSYYSGTRMAEGGVWGWAKDRSYYVFHPALLLANYNGTPRTRKMITETADGFLAHRRADASGRMQMHYTVNFHTNEDLPSNGNSPWFVLWGAYKFTGDSKYLLPFQDDPPAALRTINADVLDVLKVRDTWGRQLLTTVAPDRRTDGGSTGETNTQLTWQLTGDTKWLSKVYAAQLETAEDRRFINREGSLWIDRVYFNEGELQRARLGGVALLRNNDYPGHVVSWRFQAPANEQSVAILVPIGAPDHIKIIAYNLDSQPVTASMTGWEIDPGQWELTQGTQKDETAPVTSATTGIVSFERSASLPVTFAPRTTTVLELKLKTPGVPYWSRPDLGIDRGDIAIEGRTMRVTVHSLGAVQAPAADLVVRDSAGRELARARTPVLPAPADLMPKTAVVTLHLRATVKTGSVSIENTGSLPEITQHNNRVSF